MFALTRALRASRRARRAAACVSTWLGEPECQGTGTWYEAMTVGFALSHVVSARLHCAATRSVAGAGRPGHLHCSLGSAYPTCCPLVRFSHKASKICCTPRARPFNDSLCLPGNLPDTRADYQCHPLFSGGLLRDRRARAFSSLFWLILCFVVLTYIMRLSGLQVHIYIHSISNMVFHKLTKAITQKIHVQCFTECQFIVFEYIIPFYFHRTYFKGFMIYVPHLFHSYIDRKSSNFVHFN